VDGDTPKPCMPTSSLIFLGMARGLACRKMGKQMNWVMYVKWTDNEYQHHKSKSSFEQIDVINSNEEGIKRFLTKEVHG
jgi:hypothetical protein